MENGPAAGGRHRSSSARSAGRERTPRGLTSISAPLRGEVPLYATSASESRVRPTTRPAASHTAPAPVPHAATHTPAMYTPPTYPKHDHGHIGHAALHRTPRLAPVPGPLSSPHLARPSPPPPPMREPDAAERERRAKHARLAFAREPAFTMVGKEHVPRAPLASPRFVDNIDLSILAAGRPEKPETKARVPKSAPAAAMEKKASKAFAVRMDTPPSMERRLR